jgi:hypothetical protein
VDDHAGWVRDELLAPPAGRVNPGQEAGQHRPARVGQPDLAGHLDETWQQPHQHRHVALLVQHVGGQDQVPWRGREQGLWSVEGAHGRLEGHAVAGRVGGGEHGRLRRPVDSQDAGPGQGRGHPDQAQPAAELQHPTAGQRSAGDRLGKGGTGGPQLGPEWEAILIRVVLGQEFVQDGVAITRTKHGHGAPGEQHGVLHHVRRRTRRHPWGRRRRRRGSPLHGAKLPQPAAASSHPAAVGGPGYSWHHGFG